MSNIELVIKMSEKVYEELKRGLVCVRGQRSGKTLLSELALAIHNGISLPKGHSDLIDRNELLEQPIDTANYPSNYVRLAKAIIEADNVEGVGSINFIGTQTGL